MKRFIFLFLMTVAFGVTTTLAQDNDGKYTLQNGERTMVIDAAKGGKILSLKYGEREVISQLRWPEAFGSTFWTSPQKEWNWPPVPEYDKRPYTVEQKDGVLTLTSEVSERMKYRIRKAFAVDERDGAFVITYTIINESDEVRRVAPWEITRVQNEGGLIFFEAPVEGITPAGLMDFKDAFGAAWYQTDETNGNQKVNADGKGWLAYYNNGLLLVKQFDDLDASQPAPDEAEIQVYVNRGKAHIELESQGAYTTLQPKETVSWTVRWYLQPSDLSAEPSEKLLKQVKKILK